MNAHDSTPHFLLESMQRNHVRKRRFPPLSTVTRLKLVFNSPYARPIPHLLEVVAVPITVTEPLLVDELLKY